jgi:hypothetical protein
VSTNKVSLLTIPAPYKAMLAVCSDLDETPDRDTYVGISKYLNTTNSTVVGQGLGLEIGNSIYFDMPKDQFSYWNTDDHGRSMIRKLICAGYIDCLHSYGDLATQRNYAKRALDELSRHDCRMKVWIDHAQAPTNFGGDIMMGYGDVIGSDAYHADITIDYGIKYIWRGRVTSVIGQNVPKRISGIVNYRHPFASGKTLFKEIAKYLMAGLGSQKYAMHKNNEVLRIAPLRNGQEIIEFIRSNPFWGGVGLSATSMGFASVLTIKMLKKLIASGGVCILYTHLGKIHKLGELFSTKTKSSFELLAKFYNDKKILVTTTRRLLDFCWMLRNVNYTTLRESDKIIINVEWAGDRSELEGLSFIGNFKHAQINLNGSRLVGINRSRINKGYCYSIPWNPLVYPSI